jgi:hypothetical protein
LAGGAFIGSPAKHMLKYESSGKVSMDDQQVDVKVYAHVLGSMNHCSHCQVFIDGAGVGEQVHKADLESYPREWMEEWQQLSDLILGLAEKYRNRIVVNIVDAQSPQGLWAAIRSGIRRYPTFVVEGEKYTGFDTQEADRLISKHVPV